MSKEYITMSISLLRSLCLYVCLSVCVCVGGWVGGWNEYVTNKGTLPRQSVFV